MNQNIPAPAPVARLIQELNRLPGIGPKSAQRLAYYIIRLPSEDAQALADAVLDVKDRIIFCSVCQNLTEIDPCAICSGPRRDRNIHLSRHCREVPPGGPPAPGGNGAYREARLHSLPEKPGHDCDVRLQRRSGRGGPRLRYSRTLPRIRSRSTR